MEKQEHKSELHTPVVHPTLSIYLSGNFNDPPVNTLNTDLTINRVESAETKRCVHLQNLNKSKLQFSSVMGGYLQLLVSGLHIAWGIWRFDFRAEPWYRGANGTFIFIVLSFYVGALIGGIMSGCVVNIWRKQPIYYFSGSIMVVSSLIMIIWSTEEIGALFGRILAGFAHGLVYNVIVIHAGENAMKQLRGIVTSNINLFLWSSIFIGSLLIASVQMWSFTSLSSDRMIGIFGLSFSIIALLYTMFWTEESVVYLLNRGKLGEALELLSKLRSEPETSSDIADEFEELRLMVNDDKLENQNIFKNSNEKPLVLLVALKYLHVLTNNFLFNWIFMIITARMLPRGKRRLSPVILTAARFVGSNLQTFVSDSFGRKTLLYVSCVMAGLTLLILEIMSISVSEEARRTGITMSVLATLCILFQFFVALGVDPMHSVVLSEAFGTSKKNWSVVFVTSCENAAQMFLIGVSFVDGRSIVSSITYHLVLFISVSGILTLVIILVFHLPETKGLSLRETRNLFRSISTRCLTKG